MRRRFAASTLLLTLLAMALATASGAPAGAQAVAVRTSTVFPGLHRQVIDFRLDDGRTAVANVLSFAATDPNLELRPVLAQDRVPGLETVQSMGRRMAPRGGVAGVNGGFWLNRPVGDPNSFLSIERALVSEAETQGAGPRGTLARRGDRGFVMDRLDTAIRLQIATLPERAVTAVNRFPRATAPYPDDPTGPVYLYTPHFGGQVTVEPLKIEDVPQPLLVLTVEGLTPPASGVATGTVSSASTVPGPVAIPAGGTVIAAHGQAAARLAATMPGDEVTVEVTVKPLDSPSAEWEDVVDALAAGPLIVRRGERVDPASWEDEGFSPTTHSGVRHPRSAVALTADGRVLLVTVDGRQPGYSAGMTMHELSHFLRTLGVRDGLSLDGGGSSQMVVDGVVKNRPCCDKPLRPVGTGLFVFHHYEFTATERIAGSGRETTAAQVALTAYPDGAEEVLLASAATYPDALAGGPLSHTLGASLLLTGRDALPAATADALAKLRPERVTILGGGGAVSGPLEEQLREDYEVRRLAGLGRVETALAIARAMGTTHERVFLARADRFPDALSAAAPGGLLGMPILLTGPGELHAETAAHLERFGTREVVVLGGETAVSEAVTDELRARELKVTRLAGTSRFGTAAAVNRWLMPQLPERDRTGLVVASGGFFADALSGGPLAARRGQLLMTVPSEDAMADPEAKAFLDELGEDVLQRVTLIGGHAVLSSYTQWQLDSIAHR